MAVCDGGVEDGDVASDDDEDDDDNADGNALLSHGLKFACLPIPSRVAEAIGQN